MSAKQQAIKDIKRELKAEHKSFLAFRAELNPIINMLVKRQIEEQESIFPSIPRVRCQIVAHCKFDKGGVKLNNYDSYYGKK